MPAPAPALQGWTSHVELYTVAVSACKIEGAVNLDGAFEIYNLMQRNHVEPDEKFYACLVSVCGQVRWLLEGRGAVCLADLVGVGGCLPG